MLFRSPDEVRGAAKAMVAHAIPLHIDGETTDIVGTGLDGLANETRTIIIYEAPALSYLSAKMLQTQIFWSEARTW